ncbi:beta-1,3-galactosyltransferase 6-like isoform X2 [Watersipora subatra]
MSAPKNSERRDAIRQTWMFTMQTFQQTQVYFVIGKEGLVNDLSASLAHEHSKHNDLLLLDNLKDSYYKLTEKLVGSLTIVSKRYNFTYVMKCDDDTFIDSSKLIQELSSLPARGLYWGYFTGAARVKKSGPWAEPNFSLCDRYLPYARGGGYVLSWDVVDFIIKNSHILQIYNSEDVTIGVWLAPLNIQRIHSTGFDTESKSRGCLNHHFVSHKQSVEEMKTKQKSLLDGGVLCKKEYRSRQEYKYNWSAPPSQCCLLGVT